MLTHINTVLRPKENTRALTSFQWFVSVVFRDICVSRVGHEKKLNKKEQTLRAVTSNPITPNVFVYVCNWISIRTHTRREYDFERKIKQKFHLEQIPSFRLSV